MNEVFDLERVDKTFKNFYVDKNLYVFRAGRGSNRQMLTSVNRSFFSNARGFLCSWYQLRTILLEREDFKEFLNSQSKQENIMRNSLKKNQFIVGTISDAGVASFAPTPKVHETESDANAEAARLATINPGKKFACFKCTGIVVASGVTWS